MSNTVFNVGGVLVKTPPFNLLKSTSQSDYKIQPLVMNDGDHHIRALILNSNKDQS